MYSTYKLDFSDQILPFDRNVQLYQSISDANTTQQIYAFHDGTLYSYQYDGESKTWRNITNSTLVTEDTSESKILYFTGATDSLLVLKTSEGISFYRSDRNQQFKLLSASQNFDQNEFHDLYDWHKPGNVIKVGRFYHNTGIVGMLTNHREYGLKFHAVMEGDFETGEYPIWGLAKDFSMVGSGLGTDFYLSDLRGSGQDNVIVRNTEGLDIFKFNVGNGLERLMLVPEGGKNDSSEQHLYFPNLTGQSFRDIAVFNSSGLFIYQYSEEQNNYQFIHYNSVFSMVNGWKPEYVRSVQFVDLDIDGREDLIFTGPRGMDILSFENSTNEWRSLLDRGILTIPKRHAEVAMVLSSTESPVLFTQHKNELQWANVVEIADYAEGELEEPVKNETSTQIVRPIIPEIQELPLDNEKQMVLLRDQLEWSSVFDAVDRITGKPKFQLPLIDLKRLSSNLKLDVFYDGNSKVSDILGVGWSLPQNFIALDHQSSVFPEDEKYYVVAQGMSQQLLFDSANSTESVHLFKVTESGQDLQIRHFLGDGKWEIASKGIKQIFGSVASSGTGAIGKDLVWENWRGLGSSSSGLKQLTTNWYVAEVTDQDGNSLQYHYDVIDKTVSMGKIFTEQVYLKEIADNHGNKIVLLYGDKNKTEYNALPVQDKDGNLNTNRLQTRYLSGCKVMTSSYQQDIVFTYKLEDGKRYLIQVTQDGDPTNEPILQFINTKVSNAQLLEKIVLPTGATVDFSYQLLGSVSPITEEIGRRFDVSTTFRVDYGSDDVLISYINEQERVVLRIFNQDLTDELGSSESRTALVRFPSLGRGLVKAHEIGRAEDFVAVIMYYSTDKQLCLLRREKGIWQPTVKYYDLSEEAVIRFGRDFVVVADVGTSAELIEWDKESEKWEKRAFFGKSAVSEIPVFVAAYDRTFVVYDDNQLSLGYRTAKNDWESKVITREPGIMKNIKENLKKFDLDSKLYKQLLNYFTNNALHLDKNLILLNGWKAEEMQLYSTMHFYTLNRAYEVPQHQLFDVPKDDLKRFSYEIDGQEGNFFTIAYKFVKNKFELMVKDFRGPMLNEIYEYYNKTLQEYFMKECRKTTSCGRSTEQVEKEIAKEVEEAKDVIRKQVLTSVGKAFLLNPGNYTAILSSQTATCGQLKFNFTGNSWKQEEIARNPTDEDTLSVPLGDKLVLDKQSSQSSLKLYRQGSDGNKQGNALHDLGVMHLNETLSRNMYPAYLAYHEKDKQVGVVEFSANGNFDKALTLPVVEKLSPWSNYQTLVTSVDHFNTNKTCTVVFRRKLGIRRLLPNPVVSKVQVNFDQGSKRISGFEYSLANAFGDTVYYDSTTVIPGNEKSLFGWIKDVRSSSDSSEMSSSVFNAEGKLVPTRKSDENRNGEHDDVADEENLFVNSTLYDTSGKLEVAQFFPYELTDEEVGYYGFEDYETNLIGAKINEKRWMFNESDVVQRGFSFTGQNYLNLSEGTLVGTFQPKTQHHEYIASCWMRSPQDILDLGAVVPFLKASIQTGNGEEVSELIGEVKYRTRDWFYLEVIVNLLYIKEVEQGMEQYSTSAPNPNSNLIVAIIVGPANNTTIQVDHIRFSPLKCSFRANVYGPIPGRVKEVISANGMVKREIFNEHQESIASINEYGQLVELSTHTKLTSVGRIVKLKGSVRIQPESGFYEDFAPFSFLQRWTIDQSDGWRISPGQLLHIGDSVNTLVWDPYEVNSDSYGIRFFYSLLSANSSVKFNDELTLLRNDQTAALSGFGKTLVVPLNGEVLMVSEYNRHFIWVDGGLYVDTFSNSPLSKIEMAGEVKIENMLIFSEPRVQVTYLNQLDEKLQEVTLEDEHTAVVTGYLYDKLGRQAITTQDARTKRSPSQPLLAYYANFVTNGNPFANDSPWNTGKLQGDIAEMVGEYAFSQVMYESNPLDEKCAEGLPGSEFSVSGPFGKRFSRSTGNAFINNLFPASQNYTYQVEHKPGNVEHISVFDSKSNRIAWYVHVPKSKDLLSTYEYNDNGKLVKGLPPLYHEKVRTLQKLSSQLKSVSEEEQALQKVLGNHVAYNNEGSEITKKTPDAGKTENIYDESGLLRYTVYHSNEADQTIENVMYFDYDGFGRLNGTGKLTSFPSKDQLLDLQLTTNNTEQYQQFYQSDYEREPMWRGQMKRTITFNNGEPLVEESALNSEEETLSKRILIPIEGDTPLSISINKRYATGQLKEIEYPIDIQGIPLRLRYSYNKLGKVIGIGFSGRATNFVSYTYNPDGNIANEQHSPDFSKNFTRHYSYEGPGLLTKLEDNFLTEKVYYTSGSYGGHGHGDGTVSRTEFKATWHGSCDDRELGLNEKSFAGKYISAEDSALCFRELKEAGYLSDTNQQIKEFYPELETNLPIICSSGITGRKIQTTLGEQGFPEEYGHSYDYGNHQELTKAKYFVGSKKLLPIQSDTFSREIRDINSTVSGEIWQALKNAGYLIEDNVKEEASLAHSKRGKSFMRTGLLDDLRSINQNYGGYEPHLEKLLATEFSRGQSLSTMKLNLQKVILKWNMAGNKQQNTDKIIQMLEEKHYLSNPVREDFIQILKKYENFLPDIVRVLTEYFARQLGESEYDVESYGIDANGNHKHFYIGFDRYELSYRNNTNQVYYVKFKSFTSPQAEQMFGVKHDNRGNVIQALHKGIQQISYNPVSNRATKMQLADGRSLTFYYDAQGERLLKRVTNSQGDVTKETLYIRDEYGRVLVERQTTYISQDLPPDILTTAYIYGPKGLVGFLRRDEFYSVITDHEGSVRLVVKDGEVVAAYDYLPYGNLMRQYGSNPEGHISYRYTGQEWDEETGLYNYHARFYDPSIGRFYQVDPKGQYFSPYKYAGNSPVSMVDPDGQFAWFLIPLIIGFGLAGAYLGGSAANRNWNPAKWNWKSGKTWLGLIGGGIGGALLPVGFGASISAFTAVGFTSAAAIAATSGLGLAGSYFSIAAANNEWNPKKWDFSSPETWNAALQGFAIGSGAAGGLRMTHQFYSKLSQAGKRLFLAGSIGYGGGTFAMNGFTSGWDSGPGVLFGFLEALTAAPDMSMFLRGVGSDMRKFDKDIRNVIKHLVKNRKSLSALRTVSHMDEFWRVAQVMGALSVVALSAYAVGSAINDNGKSWDMTSVGSYQAIIHGILTGGQLSSFGKSYLKKYKANKNLKMGDPAAKISNEVGLDAVEIYKRIIDSNQIVNDPNYSHSVTLALQHSSIPNAAMTVAITDRWIVVSFSTNKAPGLVLLYSHTNLVSPVLKGRLIQHDNGLVGNRPVSLSDNAVKNAEITENIHLKHEGIKKIHVNKFDSEKKMMIIFNEERINIDAQKQLNELIKTKLSTDGYVGKTSIKQIFERHLEAEGASHPEVRTVIENLKALKTQKDNKLIELRENPKSKELKAEIDNLNKKIWKAQQELRETKKRVVARLTQSSYEYMKQFEDTFPTWEPTNCAEPHAVTAVSRAEELFPDPTLKLGYSPKDIKYMSTYKLSDLPNLTPFPRCPNCLITTAHVKNIVTDPYFFEVLNSLKIQSHLQFDFAKERLYFLLPHLHMANRLARGRNATTTTVAPPSTTSEEPRRNRRAIRSYQTSNIASSAGRIPSWISGITSWFANAINPHPKPALGGATNSSISQVSALLDGTGTLMLLDTIIRKFSGQNYSSTADQTILALEAQGYAMNITEAFEKAVEQAALRSQLPLDRVNIDYSEIQGEILGRVMSGNLSDISEMLRVKIMEAQSGHVDEKIQRRIDRFSQELHVILDETIYQSFV
ncbi:uncharacterized protein LOC109622613 [Aedes albopictus]|uniref:Latrotoxin C-terminal domain-containing protein n=1 Tax=Aedes albopictus TaxID=7160 RepID=A0ABM2A1D5_AEDAL